VTILLVLLTGASVYCQQTRRVIRLAQIEFLWLLLAGALLISMGAIVAGTPPTKGSCVAEICLIALGYTLELVPLIVKVAAITRLMHASRRMRRVKLQRSSLFGGVAVISALVLIILVIWTILNPPRLKAEYEMTDMLSENRETVVNVRYFRGSNSDVWYLMTIGWNMVLLLCATQGIPITHVGHDDLLSRCVSGFASYNLLAVILSKRMDAGSRSKPDL
jgi:hypothetical protein